MSYTIGFVTDKGLMLDLDNTPYLITKRIANYLLKTHKLEGYIIIKSSEKNYHVVFNKYIRSWKKILQIVFNQTKCARWGIWQAKKGELTLRISKKLGKNKPKIVYKYGKQDKLIAEYMEIYKMFEEY